MGNINFDFEQQPGRSRVRFYAPSTDQALVSIVTPFYNAGKYFEQTFNSVMNQTFPWFEWIIVDDGSPNREDVALLEQFAAQDPRVRVVYQKNAGPSAARNRAVAEARTDLIVPLDADDLIDATYLECLYWSLHYNPDAAWSYPKSVGFQEMEYVWEQVFSAKRMMKENVLTLTSMIRKADFLEVGGYTVTGKPFHEDWKFWLDMLSKSKKPVFVNSILFWYRRMNTGRMSGVNSDPELAKASQRFIADAAKTVDTSVEAKFYPVATSQQPFYQTEFRAWDRKVKENHDKKRVLWMIPWMVMGGADKFNLDAIAGLNRNGVENFVLMTQPSENGWRQRFEAHTDEIFCLPDFLDPAHYLEFVSYYIQSREIDMIMLTNSYDGYYMMPWIRQHFPDVAIVDYVHMEEWYWRRGGFARTSGMIGAVTEKTYVCNSATRDVLIEHFGRSPESVETVHIGVDETWFNRDLVEPGRLYQELGVPQSRPIVLFICRLHPQKRPFLMLEIAKRVIQRVPEAVFAVVGDGPQEEEMKQFVLDAGLRNNVFFLGARQDVRPYYRDARVTLVCSLKEGLSLTAYESCAMGVPVVSADVGGQKDLVDNTVGALIPCRQEESQGFDAREFDPAELQDYEDAVVQLLMDEALWQEKFRRCREKVEQAFTVERMVRRLTDEIELLTTSQEYLQKRRGLSLALNQCGLLTTELYTMEIEMQSRENALNPYRPESLLAKVKRVLREEGIFAVAKKALRWFLRKLRG